MQANNISNKILITPFFKFDNEPIHRLLKLPHASQPSPDEPLKKRTWSHSKSSKIVPSQFRKIRIRDLQKKLDSIPPKILTRSECQQALKLMIVWLEDPQNASEDVTQFIEFLEQKQLIQSSEHLIDIENLAEELEYHLNVLNGKANEALIPSGSEMPFSNDKFEPSLVLLENISLQLLAPTRQHMPSFPNKERFLAIARHIFELESLDENSFAAFSEVLEHPEEIRQFRKLLDCPEFAPFLVEGKIICRSECRVDTLNEGFAKWNWETGIEKLDELLLISNKIVKAGGMKSFHMRLDFQDNATLHFFLNFPHVYLLSDELKSPQAQEFLLTIKKAQALSHFSLLNYPDSLLALHRDHAKILDIKNKLNESQELNSEEFSECIEISVHLNNLQKFLNQSSDWLYLLSIKQELVLFFPIVCDLESLLTLPLYVNLKVEKYLEISKNAPDKIQELNSAIQKMRTISDAKDRGDLNSLSKKDRLTPNEIELIETFQWYLKAHYPKELENVIELTNKLPTFRVCFLKASRHSHKHQGWKKLAIDVYLYFRAKFLTFEHVTFLVNKDNEFEAKGLGKKGIYEMDAQTVNFYRTLQQRMLKEYDISLSPLMPENLSESQRKDFEIAFFKNLKKTIHHSTNVRFASHAWKRILGPSIQWTKTQPSDLSLDKENELICSQFVCQAIIKAHVKTCKKLGYDIPDSLSAYGLHSNDNINNLSPIRLRNAMQKKGILVRAKPIILFR